MVSSSANTKSCWFDRRKIYRMIHVQAKVLGFWTIECTGWPLCNPVERMH